MADIPPSPADSSEEKNRNHLHGNSGKPMRIMDFLNNIKAILKLQTGKTDSGLSSHDGRNGPAYNTATKDLEDLSVFRDLLVTAGHDLNTPQIRAALARFEKAYVDHLQQKACIYISGKTEIPGFRQVVLLGPAFTYRYPYRINVISVTEDGRLFFGTFKPRNPGNIRQITPTEALEILYPKLKTWRTGWGFLKTQKSWIMQKENFVFSLDYCFSEERHDLIRINHLLDCNGLKNNAFDKIENLLWQKADQRFARALKAVETALDSHILENMQDKCLVNSMYGGWLTGGDGVPGDIVVARQQAVQSYPVMAKVFCNDGFFRHIIDARDSLSDAIARKYGVSRSRVRNLQGMPWQRIFNHCEKSDDYGIRLLLRIPENLCPRTEEQFECIPFFYILAQELYLQDMGIVLARFSADGSPWRFIERTRQTSAWDIRDAVHFLAVKLYVPAHLCRIRRMTDSSRMTDFSCMATEYRENTTFKTSR